MVESLGEKLRAAREEKNLSFDQVSRETNIAARYLKALEAEDFSGFPGELYAVGFLRNYGAYLELDVQELLSLYRAFKIQEQPVPVEQLLKHPSRLPKILVTAALILLVLGGIGGAVFFFVTRPPQAERAAPVVRAPAEYVMSGDSLERRFYKGDSLLVPVDANQYKLELLNLEDAVSIRTPQRTLVLNLNEEADEDLNNDGIPDLRITAADFVKNNADMGILLRFAISAVPVAAEAVPPEAAPVETAAVPVPSNAMVVFSSPNPYPFTLQSSFRGYCMFRWEILFERDRRDRNERYFQRSDELNIQAQNGIRIWTSNAQAAKFQVSGGGRTVPIELGGAGEVVVADIRWVRDEDNRFRLVIARLET
ncbi:MAG: helix-turn-helix domain-containing protein [Treponema sp.]|jgi:cytoskeletal protein RodZ|nr:helix-turn-helix domain-containing protein [Treponema sp.]